jgi:hypothetical protein
MAVILQRSETLKIYEVRLFALRLGGLMVLRDFQ